MEDRAGAEEQQPLEHRVVERVVERRDQAERARRRVAEAEEHHRHAQAEQDDADVLHRVIREQPFQVVLHQGVEHAEERGAGADQEHREPPLPAQRADQVVDHAHHAVDRGLDHHPAHQRRDRRGRGRMRLGQPGVQRDHSRLCAEADECQHERRVRPERAQLGGAQCGEGVVAVAAVQHAEAQQDRDRADVRDQQVEEPRTADRRNAVVGGNQEVRGERHRFPRHHEEIRVVGEDDERHAGEEHVVLQADEAQTTRRFSAEISTRVHGDSCRDRT